MRRHSTIQNPKPVAYVICLGIAEFQVTASKHRGSEVFCFLRPQLEQLTASLSGVGYVDNDIKV